MHAPNTPEYREAIAAVQQDLENSRLIAGQRARALSRRAMRAGLDLHELAMAQVAAAHGRVVAQELSDAFWAVAAETLIDEQSYTNG